MEKEVTRNLNVLIRTLFVNRRDTYAKQNENGSYTRIEQPLTMYILARHLRGEITVGAYQLDENNLTRYLCFDLDPEHLSSPRETVEKILIECLNKPTPSAPRFYRSSVLLEASRYPDPSYHIWVLFVPAISAKVVRWLGLKILEHANINPKTVEVFPKQEELTKDRPFGNFVKLPLGFHQEKKKWSCFLDFESFESLPSTCLYDVEGVSLSKHDVDRILAFKEKTGVQVRFDLPKNYKPLKDKEENRIAKFLVKYWVPGHRNKLEMAFLGWAIKRGISQESARRIIDSVTVATKDEEREHRLSLVDYHYKNRIALGSELLGIRGLKDIVKVVM